MLILRRKIGTKIVLKHRATGDLVVVQVVDIDNGGVGLGFRGDEFEIDRNEIYERKQADGRRLAAAAANLAPERRPALE